MIQIGAFKEGVVGSILQVFMNWDAGVEYHLRFSFLVVEVMASLDVPQTLSFDHNIRYITSSIRPKK